MSRVPFPGKPGKFRRREPPGTTSNLDLKTDKFVSIEKTRLFLDDFYNTVGASDEEDDLNGFTQREVEKARNNANLLNNQIDSIRNDLTSAIEYHFEEKFKSVLPSKANKSYQYHTPSPSSFNKPTKPSHRKLSLDLTGTPTSSKTTPRFTKPSTTTPASISKSKHRQSLDRRRRSSAATDLSSRPGSATPSAASVKVVHHTQIQIPSWRPVQADRHLDWHSLPGQIEDLSDEAYLLRHEKAEEEEQVLWDRWQTFRKSVGASLRGRSKSRRWREVILSPSITSTPSSATAARRDRRLSSLQSEDSFCSGRLSPRTGSLQEIMVVSSTPVPPGTAPPTPVPEDQFADSRYGVNGGATPTNPHLQHHQSKEEPHHLMDGGGDSSLLMTAAASSSTPTIHTESTPTTGRHKHPPQPPALLNLSSEMMPLSPPLSPASLSPTTTATPVSRSLRDGPDVESSMMEDAFTLQGILSPRGGVGSRVESLSDTAASSGPRKLSRSDLLLTTTSTTSTTASTTTTHPTSKVRRTPTKVNAIMISDEQSSSSIGMKTPVTRRSSMPRSSPRLSSPQPTRTPLKPSSSRHTPTRSKGTTTSSMTPSKCQISSGGKLLSHLRSPKTPTSSHKSPRTPTSTYKSPRTPISSSKRLKSLLRTSPGGPRLLTARTHLTSQTSPRRRPQRSALLAADVGSPRRASMPTASRDLYPLRSQSPSRRTRAGAARKHRKM